MKKIPKMMGKTREMNYLFGGKFFQKASFQKFSFSAPKREISKFYVNFEYF